MPTPSRHVAILIETSQAYGRGLLRGITQFHRQHGNWSIYFRPHGLNEPPPAWLAHWKGDGILARIDNRKTAKQILATGLPVVDLLGELGDIGIPLLTVDKQAVARLAFEHLHERGLRRFVFCGVRPGRNSYDDQRPEYFQAVVEHAGFPCPLFTSGRAGRDWETEQQRLTQWLSTLKKPVGVMTCNDLFGQQVLDACRRAGLHVPDEIAVVGADNDAILSALTIPSLSSVDVDAERNGYEAAALLDRLMSGRKPPRKPVFLPPLRVVTRQSTDVVAIKDRDVLSVVRMIRNRGCEDVTIEEILSHVPVSRSALTRRFRLALQRTPKQELTRVRLERAKQLLLETDLPVTAIAQQSGFKEAKYFIEVFHRLVGTTPLKFRGINTPDV